MKRTFFFLGMLCAGFVAYDAFCATKVLMPQKADSVAKRDANTTTTGTGASLVPTVVGLVTNAVALNQQQKALVAECEPTAREISFVNNMVKEWANAGAQNPMVGRSITPCNKGGLDTGQNYKDSVRMNVMGSSVDTTLVCWDVYSESEARGAVWAGFPKADVASYCSDGSSNINACGKNSVKKVTNLWTIFDMIDFDEMDYTKGEASQAQALLQKAANCSGTKLAAKRLETFGGFLKNTMGNLGQTTNTGSVMDAVSGVVGQTGLGGNLGGIANVAAQFLDK